MASSSELPVRITRTGHAHRLEIDGRDVSDAVTRAQLVIDPAEGHVLRLDMVVLVDDASTNARVIVDEKTAEALKLIGWTPPEVPEHAPGCDLRFGHDMPGECRP